MLLKIIMDFIYSLYLLKIKYWKKIYFIIFLKSIILVLFTISLLFKIKLTYFLCLNLCAIMMSLARNTLIGFAKNYNSSCV